MKHSDLEALRAVLDNLRNPEMLDTHPWVARLFVQDTVARLPALQTESPGRQLAYALGELFLKMIPATPPRRGKRLDTRWGEFGILAAQYFAPLRFGLPTPHSLRDAWGRIDQAILLYVFGPQTESRSDAETATYKLVADEPQVAPYSTLSDWHTKGIQRLAEILQTHEQYLESSSIGHNDTSGDARPLASPRRPRRKMGVAARVVLILLALSFIAALIVGGLKARRVYEQALLVWGDASQLRSLAADPSMEAVRSAGPALETLRKDFTVLQGEVAPFLWLGPRLDWLPTYGGDIASAPDLMVLANSLLTSADQTYQAFSPLLDQADAGANPSQLVEQLNSVQPQLQAARANLYLARAARARLDPTRLSPRLRDLILNDVDRVMALMDDGLMLAMELPRALGASSEGPKTYLLLAENEDELRPTGGFITAAGTLLLQDGKIVNLTFQNSSDFDNWARPYPPAPWQLQQYMNSPVLIFRDANWFTDYHTAALYAEYLYSYVSNHSVDGVIAFDQQLLVDTLRVLGPIQVEGESRPVDADNVITYMRAQKIPTPEELASGTWNNKAFINKITSALIEKILSGHLPLEQLSALFVKALDERHLLIQMDNPTLADFLTRHGWDGGIHPANGDFLMVVDSNVGFNKTNAVVESSLTYDVDLTDLSAPRSQLVVTHQNHASDQVPCISFIYMNASELKEFTEENYPIDRCYWDYLRVYTLSGTKLLGASVQTIPAEWTMLHREVPPQVDILDENIEGVSAFGTLKVVPGGQSLSTNFRFALPVGVLEKQSDGLMVYRLKVQKQPGTLGVPIILRVHLPNGATLPTVPPGAVVEGQNVLFQAALTTDLEFEVVFQLP